MYFHFPLLPQCEIDPDTGQHILTQHAQHQIHALRSLNTNISDIVTQQDRAVFEAIQEGLDKINKDQAQRVCLLCNILAELTSLMFMRVRRMSQGYYLCTHAQCALQVCYPVYYTLVVEYGQLFHLCTLFSLPSTHKNIVTLPVNNILNIPIAH